MRDPPRAELDPYLGLSDTGLELNLFFGNPSLVGFSTLMLRRFHRPIDPQATATALGLPPDQWKKRLARVALLASMSIKFS